MLAKTRGIALSFVKYGDTSIISKIYTEKFGIQTYIINGTRSKKSKTKISLFQPLTLLDLVVYHRENSNIQRISEIKCLYPYSSLSDHSQKLVIFFFIQDFLSRILKNEQANEDLFKFITESFIRFDHIQEGFQNFHLQFVLKIADHLGFSISRTMDLFEQIGKLHPSQELLQLTDRLLNEDFDTAILLNVGQRREILKDTLAYFALSYDGIADMPSLEIIRDILD